LYFFGVNNVFDNFDKLMEEVSSVNEELMLVETYSKKDRDNREGGRRKKGKMFGNPWKKEEVVKDIKEIVRRGGKKVENLERRKKKIKTKTKTKN
jgi:hypothetical protein